MAKTLTIAGSNFMPRYVTGSAVIRETIQNKSNTCEMQLAIKSGQTKPAEGSEVVFKDGTRYLFGGFISKLTPQETGEGQLFRYNVEISDYSYIFNSKIARRGYNNQTLKYIVEDLMGSYVASSYGFTTTNVDTGPTIDSITFDHISIRKCFEKLQKLTGYVWWVDYQANLYFKPTNATAAPESITDSTNNFEDIQIEKDTSQCRNSVIVIGSDDGEESLSYTEQSFTGDGETRSWELEDKPSQIVFIKINGVEQQYSLDVNERDTDVFTYSFSGQSFQLTAAQVTPTGGDTILIRYYPRVPIIARKTDPTSIAYFSALDGGDGILEYTIKESSVTSKASAAERALQELEEYAFPLVNATFITNSTLLSGGSIFTPGQYVIVNLPSYGISTDTAFLIQEVTIEMKETDASTTVYKYAVRFGGKMVGVREFLETLASESGEVNDVSKILTIEGATDEVEIADSGLTQTKFTPPFKYTSGTPKGMWNKSEWA